MAEPVIKIKRSSVPGKIPTTASLPLGEIALNTNDGKVYIQQDSVGIGSTVIVVNPWSVGLGSNTYNTFFTVGSVGIGTTIPTSSLHVVGNTLVTGIVTTSSLRGYSALVGTASSTTTTFVVTVASKSANHRYFGTGSGSAYFIDGIESPFLTLLPGKTYRFTQEDASNSSHPILFYYQADKTTGYTTNVTTTGTPGSAGAYTEIVVTDTTPVVLHYQCSNHGYMGNAAHFSSNVVDTPYQITARSGINVTGVVTATTFVGALTGTATTAQGLTGTPNLSVGIVTATTFVGALTGTATTAQGLTGTPNLSVGIVTATSFSGSGTNLTGIVTSIVAGTNVTISGSTGQVTINASGGGGGSSQWVTTDVGIHTLSSVGIGTTNPTSKLTVVGVVSATSFSGSGAGLTSIPAGQLTGSLPAIDGSALTGIVAGGSGVIIRDDGSPVGTATTIDFGANLSVSFTSGIATITGSGGGNSTTRTTSRIIATENQTLFSVNYTVGYVDVFLNGSKLDSTEYTAINGTTVTLTEGANVNDCLEFVTFSSISLSGTTVIDDINTDAVRYITLTDATSGSISSIRVASTELTFNSGTNTFTTGNIVGTNLNISGISTLGVTSASNLTSQTLNVSGISTLGVTSASNLTSQTLNVSGISTLGVTSSTNLTSQQLNVSGIATISISIPSQIRLQNVAEKLTRTDGNTVSINYSGGGGNIGLCTNPTGNITLNVTGILTDSSFDNHSILFSVVVIQTGTARTCTAVNLNGVSKTIKWFGGSLASAISGVTTTSGYDIYNFTGINTVGSASTTTNYEVLGIVNGGFR